MTDNKRPEKRKARVEIWLDNELYEQALIKAGGSRKRLRAILRAFLRVWGSDEYPDLPDDVIEQELKRATGGGRHRKRKPPATDNDSD